MDKPKILLIRRDIAKYIISLTPKPCSAFYGLDSDHHLAGLCHLQNLLDVVCTSLCPSLASGALSYVVEHWHLECTSPQSSSCPKHPKPRDFRAICRHWSKSVIVRSPSNLLQVPLMSVSPRRIWLHELIVPAYAALLSIAILLLQLVCVASKRQGSGEDTKVTPPNTTLPTTLGARLREHASRLGGCEIFAYRLVRLVSSIALVALSIYTIVAHKHTQGDSYVSHLQFALLGVYVSFF